METTVISTAMPTVIASLGQIEIYSWAFSAYVLANTLSATLWGRLSDFYGKGRFYMVAMSFFILGSALSGLAQSMTQLCVFRFIQGIGGGGIIPIAMAIVGEAFPLEQRARLQGAISGIWGVASLVGPLVGGLIADHLSWRWVFYVNIPLGIAAALLLSASWQGTRVRAEERRLDVAGFGLLTSAMALLLVFLLEAGERLAADAHPHWPLLGGSAALFALFVRHERRTARPLVPLALWSNRIFRAAIYHGLFTAMAMFGSLSFVPLFVQGVIGTSATTAGSILTPFILSWVFFSVLSSRLILTLGYRRVILAGVAAVVVGFVLMRGMDTRTGKFDVSRNLAIAGSGMGLSFVPMLIATQNAVARDQLGIATSGLVFFRNFGATLGLGVMGAAMNYSLARALPELEGLSPHEIRLLIKADTLAGPLNGANRDRLRAALDEALHGVFWIGLLAALFALPSAWLIPAGKARQLVHSEGVAAPPSSS
ncbi:MAG: MFS transporter [Nitrospirae bacterium]|nr:MFS transporter [Nitrospirota bacterium]